MMMIIHLSFFSVRTTFLRNVSFIYFLAIQVETFPVCVCSQSSHSVKKSVHFMKCWDRNFPPNLRYYGMSEWSHSWQPGDHQFLRDHVQLPECPSSNIKGLSSNGRVDGDRALSYGILLAGWDYLGSKRQISVWRRLCVLNLKDESWCKGNGRTNILAYNGTGDGV
jgi:predicted phosphoadenosine phosphosulfate sulfurtransferase